MRIKKDLRRLELFQLKPRTKDKIESIFLMCQDPRKRQGTEHTSDGIKKIREQQLIKKEGKEERRK